MSFTLQKTVCGECIVEDHQDHPYEKIETVKDVIISDMKRLIGESKSKLAFCNEATSALENGLSELQTQREHAKGLINETFHSCKDVLEKLKVLHYNVNLVKIQFHVSLIFVTSFNWSFMHTGAQI